MKKPKLIRGRFILFILIVVSSVCAGDQLTNNRIHGFFFPNDFMNNLDQYFSSAADLSQEWKREEHYLSKGLIGGDDSSSPFIRNFKSNANAFFDYAPFYFPPPSKFLLPFLPKKFMKKQRKFDSENQAMTPKKYEELLILAEKLLKGDTGTSKFADHKAGDGSEDQCQRDVDIIYIIFLLVYNIDLEKSAIGELYFRVWPFVLVDSWGKSENGIFGGNIAIYGRMKQCLSVQEYLPTGETPPANSEAFKGQYCYIRTSFLDLNPPFPLPPYTLVPYSYGTCVPSTCSQDTVTASISSALENIGINMTHISCQTKDDSVEIGTWEIVGSTMIALMVLPVLIATVAGIFKNSLPPLLKAFSASENMSQIAAVKESFPGEISCFHGIRVLSICWVMLGHQFIIGPDNVSNTLEIMKETNNWAVQIIWSGYRAVDTFFFLGGFLVAKSLLSRPFCVPSRKEKQTKRASLPTSAAQEEDGAGRVSENNVIELSVRDEKSSAEDQINIVDKQPSSSSLFIDEEVWMDCQAFGLRQSITSFLSSYAMYVFHRIIRLLPSMFFMTMFFAGWSTFFIDGPRRELTMQNNLRQCREGWWYELVFASNILLRISSNKYKTDPNYDGLYSTCLPQCWYVAVDFQIYLMLPFLILPLKLLKHKAAYLIFLIFLSGLIPALIIVLNNLPPTSLLGFSVEGTFDYNQLVYRMPYSRAGPYFVGALCALILIKAKEEPNSPWMIVYKNKWFQCCGWIINTVIALTIVFCFVETNYYTFEFGFSHDYSSFVDFVYGGYVYIFWGLCVGWIVVACVLEQGGPVNSFLSHPIWQPFSRVSFFVFLFHLPLQIMIYMSSYDDNYMTFPLELMDWLAVVVISFVCSFFFSLIAEAPYINLLKLLVKKR